MDEIKKHPFFKGTDWKNIWSQKAPFVPELSSETDTANFQVFEDETQWDQSSVAKGSNEDKSKLKKQQRDYFWIGYTYKRPEWVQMGDHLEKILEQLQLKRQ